MTNEAKISKIQTNFKALSEVASSLNEVSDKLTKTVALLDESLKKLNIGLTVWVNFRYRGDDGPYYNADQIGYTKVGGAWGIALRHIWGDESIDDHNEDGPWLFNDGSRELRLNSVDKLPEVIEELAKEALATKKKIEEKTQEVLGLAAAISPVADAPKAGKPTSLQTDATMRLSELAGPIFGTLPPPPPPLAGVASAQKPATRPAPPPAAPTRRTDGSK